MNSCRCKNYNECISCYEYNTCENKPDDGHFAWMIFIFIIFLITGIALIIF